VRPSEGAVRGGINYSENISKMRSFFSSVVIPGGGVVSLICRSGGVGRVAKDGASAARQCCNKMENMEHRLDVLGVENGPILAVCRWSRV